MLLVHGMTFLLISEECQAMTPAIFNVLGSVLIVTVNASLGMNKDE